MLPSEYLYLFTTCEFTNEPMRLAELKDICRVALANQFVYYQVSQVTGVPWQVIAAIHYRESDQSFKCHLHNGDPLTAKTVHVPSGRPVQGQPPFTWTASAIDALAGRWKPYKWDVPTALEYCERYNGLGYRRRGVNTPYLWACTNKYASGLFVADGHFDPSKIDTRPGVAAILKAMSQWENVSLDFTIAASPNPTLH